MDSDSEESLKSDIFEEDDNEKTNKTDMDEGKLVINFFLTNCHLKFICMY